MLDAYEADQSFVQKNAFQKTNFYQELAVSYTLWEVGFRLLDFQGMRRIVCLSGKRA